MQRHHGHVKFVATRVLDGQEFGCSAPRGNGLEAQITADSVILVHHRVTFRELREVPNDGLGVSRVAFPAPPLFNPLTE